MAKNIIHAGKPWARADSTRWGPIRQVSETMQGLYSSGRSIGVRHLHCLYVNGKLHVLAPYFPQIRLACRNRRSLLLSSLLMNARPLSPFHNVYRTLSSLIMAMLSTCYCGKSEEINPVERR